MLLGPLPYHEPDRIVGVWATRPEEPRTALAPANFLDLQRGNTVFAHVAAYREDVFDLAGNGGDPQRLEGAQVTAGFFDVFGVPALLGRSLHDGQDAPERDRVAVLGEAAWTRAFGRDPHVVGRTVHMNGEPVTVVLSLIHI